MKVMKNRIRPLICILFALVAVVALPLTAAAQTTYPVQNGPDVGPSTVTTTQVTPGLEVLGSRFTRAQTLPVTGADALGLVVIAGAFLVVGTVLTLRSPKTRGGKARSGSTN